MNLNANHSVVISRTQVTIGLIIAALALLKSIGAAALLFSTTALALLLPVPAAVLFLGIFYLLIKEQPLEPADTIDEVRKTSVAPAPEPPAVTERTVTVDEDRETYGIYATLQTISASLSLSDTLNLVADRIGRLIPGSTIIFALADADEEPLCVTAKFGRYSELFALGDNFSDDEAPAESRVENRGVLGVIRPKPRGAERADIDLAEWPSIAAPMVFEGAVFGAIALLRGEARGFVDAEVTRLESVAIFASTGIHHALNQRQSHDTAMFDSVLSLPNMRAAHTIVDQRIADALRHRSDEPLGLICLRTDGTERDLKEFCQLVGGQLRHMDILTRGEGGELWIVLPRSGRPEAALVADRILRAQPTTAARPQLSLGLASFPHDGSTGGELFREARNALQPIGARQVDQTFDNVVLVDQWR